MIIEEIEIKEEVFIKKENCSSSSLEETCSWYVQQEDIQVENTENKGRNLWLFVYIYSNYLCFLDFSLKFLNQTAYFIKPITHVWF